MTERMELLAFLRDEYRGARDTRRDVRASDRLKADLDVDSMLVSEMLIALEDRYDVRLLHDPRVWTVTTVGDLLDVIATLETEQRATSAL